MRTLLTGGTILTKEGLQRMDISIDDHRVFAIGTEFDTESFEKVIHCDNFFIVPGFIDVHVHLREPGLSYKETIETGTAAAAKGGYTTVCSMPNVSPAPVDRKTLQKQLDLIKRDAKVKVIPYGAITADQSGRGDLSAMEEMADNVLAFSDDGRGVQGNDLMKEAMITAKKLGKIIVAHCEDEEYDTYNKESEWRQAKRDIRLVKETGCAYHICHVSTLETVELVRKAKAEGLPVTCETAPHYLVLDKEQIRDEGRFKMNPPIRGRDDRQALIRGIQDGTIDMIATDHAPHSQEEKKGNFQDSLFGIVGLETAFSVLYTKLVKEGLISFQNLMELMWGAPARVFGLSFQGIAEGAPADLAVLDLNKEYTIDVGEFASKGRSTPFAGWEVTGKVVATMVDGEIV
ncbi:MAG: dihydroorotase [Anaerovoracaceae bacterium]